MTVNAIADNEDFLLVNRREIKVGDLIRTKNGKFVKAIGEPSPNQDGTYFVKVEIIDDPGPCNWDFAASDSMRYSKG